MAGSGRKWLTGCGIGCGILILVVGGIGTCSFFSIKKIADRADDLEANIEALDERYGELRAYVPAADGRFAADRIEVFLAVREDNREVRESMATVLAGLQGEPEGPGDIIDKIRGGMALIPRMFDFIDQRNEALLDRGMGLGEYLHIYTVVYYAWLEHDPSDGPAFTISDNDQGGGGFRFNIDDEDAEDDVRDRRDRTLRDYLHPLQESMLANQLDAAELAGLDPSWLEALRVEAARMDELPRALLWEDGVPARTVASLEPYRAALEDSYVPIVNALEVELVRKD